MELGANLATTLFRRFRLTSVDDRAMLARLLAGQGGIVGAVEGRGYSRS